MRGTLERLRDWARRMAAPLANRGIVRRMAEQSIIGQKKTEVTFESHRVLIVRRLRSTRVWCPACGHEVDMVRPEEALSLARSDDAQLPENAARQSWHMAEDTDGSTWICLESVLKASFPDLDSTGTG